MAVFSVWILTHLQKPIKAEMAVTLFLLKVVLAMLMFSRCWKIKMI